MQWPIKKYKPLRLDSKSPKKYWMHMLCMGCGKRVSWGIKIGLDVYHINPVCIIKYWKEKRTRKYEYEEIKRKRK